MGNDERSVEQESGDQEEDGHADFEPRRILAQGRLEGETGKERGMNHQDGNGGDRTQSVESGEMPRPADWSSGRCVSRRFPRLKDRAIERSGTDC
jgi:hypothetical protein